jgi:AraC-like DNA-binding protein
VVDALVLPGHEQSLTTLAYRFGYADQSHFIKAFQQVMNEPPSRFVQEQYILPIPQ